MDKNIVKKIIDNEHISQSYIAKLSGSTRQFINLVYKGLRPCPPKLLAKLNELYPKYFNDLQMIYNSVNKNVLYSSILSIKYNNDVFLIDSKMLDNESKHFKNNKSLEIIDVFSDSMFPELKTNDKILIDKSVNTFIDDNIYLFELNNQTYIRRINVLPDKIKCIALNKEFDTFYIEKSDSCSIIGLIHPRIRF